MNHSARRIQQIGTIVNATSYLEIGVESGRTFNSLSFESKTAVDPAFLFSVPKPVPGKLAFHEEPSDEFFRKLPNKQKYDLIFIDGLHTWDQTYRDFCNSLLHSRRRTVIILDDTVPCDEFSALRDAAECVKLRSISNSPTKSQDPLAWHGDTYKSLILIKLFHPSLDYATITDGENPQTVVWSAKRHAKRVHTHIEAPYSSEFSIKTLQDVASSLDSVGYAWFSDNRKLLLQETTEANLMKYLESIFSDG